MAFLATIIEDIPYGNPLMLKGTKTTHERNFCQQYEKVGGHASPHLHSVFLLIPPARKAPKDRKALLDNENVGQHGD